MNKNIRNQSPELEIRFRDLSRISTYLVLFRPFRWQVTNAFIFAIIKHSVLLILPLFIAYAIDEAIPAKDFRLLLWILAGMGVTVVVNFITARLYSRSKSFVLRSVSKHLRSFICSRIQQMGFSYYDRTHSGKLYSKVMLDVERLSAFGSYLFEPLATSATVGLGMVLVCLWKEPRITAALCICLPLLVAINKVMNRQMQRNHERIRQANERMAVSVSSMLQTLRLARAHGQESVEIEKVESSNESMVQAGMKLDYTAMTLSASIWGVGQFTIILILGFASYAAMQTPPTLSIGEVTLFITYFTQINGMLAAIVGGYDVYVQGRDALVSLGEVVNCPDMEINEGLPQVEKVDGRIRFDKVSFRYPGIQDSSRLTEQPPPANALQVIDVEIESGEHVALVGPSGSGKSTFASLLLGFYRPTEGRVLIDGHDIAGIDMRSVRRSIGVVSQDNVLFEGTIKDNISHNSQDQYSMEDVMEASKAANAHGFISALPQGYDTRVGERGVSLSGGQRQRIAIARALLRDPAILLLDEATSALDTVSEKEVQSALIRVMKGRTTVTIAHRLSTIRKADKILVFDKGRIVEKGDHESLYSLKEGLYREMLMLQVSGMGP